ncbi:MAG: DUF2199 domain-containing protein [Alphaproteobacteria bacterium]|nr:DUF2199 domain-containing protein [Alphaproteobacteria bacterium]
MTDLAQDPRWRRINDREFECPCCGKRFGGVYDVVFDHPDPWGHGNRAKSGEDILWAGKNWLSSDLCVQDGDYFVRCIMPFPIIGSDQSFAFGVWGSVSKDSFKHFYMGFDTSDYGDFTGCFSWLSNNIPHVGQDDWIPCDLMIEDPTKRPVLYAQSKAAAVRAHQENGITFDQLLDIYASAGNDIRPHLLDG